MKQSGVLPDIDGHYERPSCQTSSSPLLLNPSKWAGWAIIFNWCCFSTSNGMTVEYLFRNLIPQGINTFWSLIFQLKKINMHIYEAACIPLCTSTFSLKRESSSEMNAMGKPKEMHQFCIFTWFGKSCGAVGSFYFMSQRQQTQLWLEDKRGKLFLKIHYKNNQLSLGEVCSPSISSCLWSSGLLPVVLAVCQQRLPSLKWKKEIKS